MRSGVISRGRSEFPGPSQREQVTMKRKPTVFVVDDDPRVRRTLQTLLEAGGIRGETFGTGRAFLDAGVADRPGCLLVDFQLPDMTGLEVIRQMAARPIRHPIIVMSGRGDVGTVVQTIKAGAFDFVEKPIDRRVLLDRVRQAIDQDVRNRREYRRRAGVVAQLSRLTARERQVMELVVAGEPNKRIAAELGISQRTVEIHRANVMKKTEADSLADLVRLADFAQSNGG